MHTDDNLLWDLAHKCVWINLWMRVISPLCKPPNSLRALVHSMNEQLKYVLANLPLKDELLKSAKFVNISSRDSATFAQVEYFVQRHVTMCMQLSLTDSNYLTTLYMQVQYATAIPICRRARSTFWRVHRVSVVWWQWHSTGNLGQGYSYWEWGP